jgi:class 3 adenylate cyclase
LNLPTGTVTFLMTDVEGSTKLWERFPDQMRAVMARHDAIASEVIARNNGLLLKSRGEGDSLFTVFDRASDAVAAALDLQQTLLTEPWPPSIPIKVRVALHTGEADLREGDYYGSTVNRCARLRGIGHGQQVLLSSSTAQLARPTLPEGAGLLEHGHHQLRDIEGTEEVSQLLHPKLPTDFPPLRSTHATNLPRQLTSFVGREKEIAEVRRLLGTAPLLTLTGSGGCGKTRLAIEVAGEVLTEYQDGVFLVELAALADPALVPQTTAAALGVREEPGRPILQTLVDHLKEKRLLLLLDNCEHLLDASAQLADTLLRSCAKLQILASSREGLGISGETSYRIPSLSMPEPKPTVTADEIHDYEAIRLFEERARAAQPSFSVNDQNAPSVAQLCVRLDGIPLAIELAAARVKALSVEQIAARLDDRFRLLTGGSRTALPRQQTLRAMIDWSYDLLTPKEQTLLRRLSVFAGGWTLEAAEKVCADDVAAV